MTRSVQQTVSGVLEGEVALVTGGAGGIGRAVCEELSSLGARVVVADLDESGAVAVAAALGRDAVARALDLTDDESVAALAAEMAAMECSILVSAAGAARVQRFVDSDPATWDGLYRINQRAPMLLAHGLVGGMVERGHGRVVLISSDGARAGSWGETVYAATKSALFGFAKSLARETARHGVTVNVVCPGPTRTPMLDQVGGVDNELLARLERAVPMRRLGEPEDVAGAVAYLAGPGSAYVTGQVLSVSGGITMH